MTSSRRWPLAANAALAVAYAAIGLATLALGETGGVELRRVIWASSGFAVTAGLLAPFPMWPGAAAGGVLATLLSGSGLVLVVGTGVANGLEVALAVALLRRLRFDTTLERVRDVLLLIVAGAGASSAVGALISVSALAVAGGVPAGGYPRMTILWWLTHAIGILVVTPVGVTLARGRAGFARRHPLEVTGVLTAIAAVSWLPFSSEQEATGSHFIFLVFPLLLWAAIRLGMSGAALGGLIATSVAVVAAVRNTGPLGTSDPTDTLVMSWLYVNVVMVSTLISAALVAGMERARVAHEAGEARLRAVLDGASAALVVTDPVGIITHVNRAAVEHWPARSEPPRLGQSIDPVLASLRSALRDPAAGGLLVRTPDSDPRRGRIGFANGRAWDVSTDRLAEQPTRLGSLWSFQDVTQRLQDEEERRQMQEQLLHGQKLESLGVMAGGIAHDFNNLLMAIRARAELIGDTPGVGEEVAEDAEGILRVTDQAAALCRQMLTYAGRGAIDVVTLDLAQALREIQDLLRHAVSSAVELRLDFGREPLLVAGDVAQLRQVVLNMVTNASDAVIATGRGGRVILRLTGASLSREWLARAVIGQDAPEGEFCLVEVIDNGVGLSDGAMRRVFDPFYSSKGTGRGLGLSSALGVVRRHKGALSVESRPGEGSRFTMALPRASALAEPSVPDEPLPGVGAFEGRTILVVDDDTDVRNAVSRMLVRLGVGVEQASDGDEALQVLSGARGPEIDLVLLDLTMPRRSGPATLAAMRAAGIVTPVIIASGYSAEALPPEGDVTAFVQKPYRMEELSRAINSVLART